MNAKPALVRPRLASDLDRLIAHWITRIVANYSSAVGQLNDGLYSQELRQLLGIRPLDEDLIKVAVKPLLKSRIAEFAAFDIADRTILYRNVRLLGAVLNLDKLQIDILAFSAAWHQHPLLSEIMDGVRTPSIDSLSKFLAVALNVRERDVNKAIRPDGQLLGSRVATLERSDYGRGFQIEIPSRLRQALFLGVANVESLMRSFLEHAPNSKLKADAFGHLTDETALLTTYLTKVQATRTPGVNVLIYGPPGTGKTEYVRWLAAQLKRSLYQVKSVDDDGDVATGMERLSYFQLSQRFLKQSDAFILFDEIEDVFPRSDAFMRMFSLSRRGPGKMFVNQLLESNPVPAFWISNEIEQIDKAYLRRFDFSFEMNVPPIAVRKTYLRKYFNGLSISDETMRYLAQQDELSPAQMEKAAKVLTVSQTKAKQREDTLLLVIENSSELLGLSKRDALIAFDECSYQLDFLNPDCDVKQLVAQLKQSPDTAGAMCFYGPPGTGKTALAHYIASEIEIPLLAKRASDIISPYVGETEQKIAAMFKQAKQEGAMLLLDEADSFLTDRQGAKHSWEVTAVNEMLTQMESFDGLFVCSTNLMQRLDAASLRRFALKIKFDYLKHDQRWALFVAQAKKLNQRQAAAYRSTLDQLTNLTPGDFATVRRQAALFKITLTADELITRLQQECRNKGGSSRPIGFVHS